MSPISISSRGHGSIISTWGGNDLVSDADASIHPTTVDTGLGIDTAQYSGLRAAYTTTHLPGGGWSVLQSGAIDDTLKGVERLAFADAHVALDLDGNAGTVAKLMGLIFGASLVQNPYYMGVALSVVDGGVTSEQLMGFLLDLMLGSGATHAQVVSLVYTNLAGVPPTPEQSAPLVQYLDEAVLTPARLGVLAAEHPANLFHIDFAGLQQHGLAFEPY